VVPIHKVVLPDIALTAGAVFTVTVLEATALPQLLLTVYDMIVVPGDIPETTPVALTEAVAAKPVLHVPPVTASARVVVAPLHTEAVPVITPAFGNALTVIAVVVITPDIL
jgi:hypothetical protein